MINSRRIGWVGHIAHMGEIRIHTEVCSENLKGRDHFEDLVKDGGKISQCILQK
jgi:hypothetical protein